MRYDCRVPITPANLRGRHVVEAGVRQAWPFLTFADGNTDTEVRLYIDADFHIEPEGVRSDDGDSFRAGRMLIDFTTLGVTEASTTPDGALVLAFDNGQVLRVSGTAASFTTGGPWSLAAQ
jgi:hypothetical protein